jgi:uncharacterized protein with HEPN domain
MTEEARKYLFDILKAIELIENFTVGLDNFLFIKMILKLKVQLKDSLA